MKKILYVLLSGLATTFSAFGSAENEKDTCCNYNTKKCLLIDSGECDSKNVKDQKTIPSDEDCPPGYVEVDTKSKSTIESLSYNYTHDVVEYVTNDSVNGCQSCSGGDIYPSNFRVVTLKRFHRFRQMSDSGSFGKGIFSNYDNRFTLYESGTTPRIDMFFGEDMSMRRYFKQGSQFFDTFARSSKLLEIRKSDGTPTTVIDEADHAVLETMKGEIYKFEIFTIDEFTKGGRLISITDRNGYALQITYLHEADAQVDPSQKYQLLTVTDPSNRVLSFEYLPETRQGGWVVNKANLPNGSFIKYNYGSDSDSPLESVEYPDGTLSVFTSSVKENGHTSVTIFEAGEKGTHRRKELDLDSNFNAGAIGRDGVKYWNSASLLINDIKIGSEDEQELTYSIHQNPNHHNNRRIFEGGNLLKSINIATADFYKEWDKLDPEGDFDDFVNLKKEETSAKGDWKFYLANAQMRPPVISDKHGLKHKYVYNSGNQKTKTIYEDETNERWSYNEFNLKTRHRDRLGRVTHWEYDARGNLTKKTVGLKAVQSGTAGEEVPGLLCKVYDHTNNVLPTNFESLDPVETLSVPNLELDVTDREDTYALLFTGEIEITNAGDYTFYISSDDGSKLYIDGVEIIDNDGLHGLKELSNEVPVVLDAGKHAIRVEFFEKYGAQQLFLKYQGPDSADVKILVPDSAYSHLTVEEELAETDVTTPDTAEYLYSYYPTGHANQHLLHTETDANGNITEYIYNSDNLLTEIKIPTDDGLGQIIKSSFTYDSAKRVSSSTDAVGRSSLYAYDSRERVIRITYSDFSTELFFYGTGSNANLLTKKKDRNGNTTKFEYDSQGRANTTIRAYSVMNEDGSSETVNPSTLQSIEECTYVPGLDLKASCTINGELTEYFYDYRNRLVETRTHADNNSILVNKSFYKNNLKQFTEDPYGRRTYFSYRITSNAKSDAAKTRMVQETVPGAVFLPNGYYSDIENLPRILTNNAPYLVTDYINDDEGQVIATIDPRGIRHETDYDFRGRTTFQIAAADTLAQTTQALYDANSNVIEVRNPRYFSEGINDRTVMTYNDRNLLETRTLASGSSIAATESFTYYDDGRAKDHTDFRGNTSIKVWKQCCGRLGVVAGPVYTDKDGNQRRSAQTMQYDHFGNVTHTTTLEWDAGAVLPPCCYPDPSNDDTLQEVTTKYDARHRPIARTVWLQPLDAVDANDVPIATDTAQGLTTTYEYFDELEGHSELSEIVSELLADGISLGAPQSPVAQGSAVITTNPEGEKSVAIMDGAGRTVASGMLSKVDGSLVTWSTVTHDTVVNNLLETKTTSALGFENKQRTDGVGRRINAIDAEGKVSNFSYDANSNLVSFRDSNGVGQDCVFDDLNRDEQCTDTEGSVVSKDFDLNNNVLVETDAKGKTTTCVFDERNRKTSCTDRLDALTSYTYDANSNLNTIIDDKGKTTSYDYDERNLQVKVTYADHINGQNPGDANYGITTCSYDALGRKSLFVDQKGEKVEYLYDFASRLEDRVYYLIDDTEESRDEFTYDLASRPLTASKGRYSNIISYTYDEIGRTKTETTTVSGSDYTTTYDYDADSRLTEILYPAGNSITRDYTDRNQLESVAFNAAPIITSTFDDGGREETRTFGNNLVATNAYNLDNTLASRTVAGKAALSFSYDYDANKNVEGESTGGALANFAWTAGFDDGDRVTSWNRNNGDNQSWNLDTIGNWDSTTGLYKGASFNETRAHNDVHELTDINGSTLSYDSKGNPISIPGAPLSSAALTWDIDNHLASYIKDSITTTFTYDALGRRLEKLNPTKNTLFISASQQVIEEYESVGAGSYALARSYTYGSYIDDVLAKVETVNTPTVLYYHSDRQFNVRGLTDSSGNIKELYTYTPYGKQCVLDSFGTVITSSSFNNNYGFTGRYLDNETGLWYFRARYFSDELGRFISRDPLGYVDGMSLYNGYFAQEFGMDPSGREKWVPKLVESDISNEQYLDEEDTPLWWFNTSIYASPTTVFKNNSVDVFNFVLSHENTVGEIVNPFIISSHDSTNTSRVGIRAKGEIKCDNKGNISYKESLGSTYSETSTGGAGKVSGSIGIAPSATGKTLKVVVRVTGGWGSRVSANGGLQIGEGVQAGVGISIEGGTYSKGPVVVANGKWECVCIPDGY